MSRWVTTREAYALFHDSSTFGNQHRMQRPKEERKESVRCEVNMRGTSDRVYAATSIDDKLKAALDNAC